MRQVLSFLAAAFFAATAQAQTLPALPSDWVARPPIASEQERSCANWSGVEWRVLLRDGVINAERVDRRGPTPPARLAFADGQLIGIDQGEWGGALHWQPNNGPAYRLIKDNTTQVFIWNEHVFAAGGLAHMGISEGYIAQLERSGASWRIVSRTDLSGPVYAVDYTSPAEIVIVLPDGVHVMNPAGEITRIFSSDYWWALYPNSVLRLPNGDILVGMRYAIARLHQEVGAYVETLLLPIGCEAQAPGADGVRPNCPCMEEQ